MPKYLIHAAYTPEGAKGLIKSGGSKRRQQVEKTIQSLGGKLEAFYFAFGEADAIAIADIPSNAAAAATALVVNASGAVQTKTTVLLTPEEIDQAAQQSVDWTPPGQ